MAALSFIGKPISLISHSDVRYRGILAGIDPVASTIQLSNVYSMGTESRRPPQEYIPPVQEPYTYIIFRASEVKDLAVDEPANQRRNVHDDPAVIGASAPQVAPNYPLYGSPSYPQQAPAGVSPQPGQAQVPPRQQQQFANRQQGQPSGSQPGQTPNGQTQANGAAPPRPAARNPSVNSATASMETIERAIGDLRVSNVATNGATQQQRGGRRGGGRQGADHKASDLRVPATDFDFESSNARFDKAALAPSPRGTPKNDSESPEGEEKEEEKEKEPAYNPKKSFFDSLSSGSNGPGPSGGEGRGRGGRRGGGRNRREEERERNVATFGEPGGVGLMGPGAYVGGWGGYGRRGGGGRGRRGGAIGARS
ncbi:Scd6-like Sm domain-containing protein [Dichomitus squalens]|uniref:Scd6-like Sm domain-containing protein n=1 Tax=Dichomitus squalens TaxID=114155 RepID=A0A4Q9N4N4_9APHY|nr:Scd6-like Sm domain-containing protein [Dichomitus squalens]